MTFGKHQESSTSNLLVLITYLIEASNSLCYSFYQHFLYNTKGVLQHHRPPTGHRPPTADHRRMDRSSTDPPTTDRRLTANIRTDPPTNDPQPTDRFSTNPPTTDPLAIDPLATD